MNYYPSSFYRIKARNALKGHWQTALLIALIVNLPTLLVQGFTIYTGNDPLDWFQALVITASRDGTLSRELLLRESAAFFGSTGFLLFQGLCLVAWLITPCLSLGMNKWLLDRLQGREGPVTTVFSRVRWFLKAIGLQLLIILKILLWSLPGIALMVAGYIPLIRAGADLSRQLAALKISDALMIPSLALMIIPGVMAALRYALSDYILAETPENGIRACIRRSKELTADCRRNLLLLMLHFLLLYLCIMLVSSFLAGMGPGVLPMMFQILANLVLSLYMSCSVAAFYRTRAEENLSPAPEEPREDESVLS